MPPRFEQGGAASGPVVQGFSGGRFSIDGQAYDAALLTPERALPWSPPSAVADLVADDLALLLALDPAPEFLIIGTGARQAFPARSFVRDLEDRGIGVEAMDSRAAARTWGMLRAEGRWIAAALMPIV